MPDAHKNFAYSTVATAPSPATSGTSLVVAAGEGARFPAVPFNATIHPANQVPTPANAEIVRVTAISTDTLTITRAQESTTARSVIVGDWIFAGVTAKTLTDVETLTLINSTIVGVGGVASVTISSIPGTYKHLLLMITGRSDAAGVNNVNCGIQFNGDTGLTYQHVSLVGTGAASSVQTNDTSTIVAGLLTAATATASHAGTIQAMIFDYARTSWFKALNAVGQWGIEDAAQVREYRGTWESTAAITSITVVPSAGNLVENTRVDLWGVN